MKGTTQIWIYEDFRMDDAAGARCFVALEWARDGSIGEHAAVEHLRRNSDDGARIEQQQDPFFGDCYMAVDGDGNLLGRVRRLEAI